MLVKVQLYRWIGRRKSVHLVCDAQGETLSIHSYADDALFDAVEKGATELEISRDDTPGVIRLKVSTKEKENDDG